MNTSGFYMADSIKPGTIIERVYFAAPEWHGYAIENSETESFGDTLRVAIEHAEKHVARQAERYGADSASVVAAKASTITVDVRWTLRLPNGGTTDSGAERYSFDGIADARAHLERLQRYSL